MQGLMGTKIGMTQMFEKDGRLLPVTVIYVEPNRVLELKTEATHGYVATKLGYYTISEDRLNKPQLGFFKKMQFDPQRYVREIRDMSGAKVGDELHVGDVFKPGQLVDVQARNKGHGYTGAIKKWNFKIGPLAHGAGYKHRYQGSIETGRGGSQAQRVFKGKKMAGRWGNELVTIQNLVVVSVDNATNLLVVRGAIPGPSGCLVVVRSSKKKPNRIVKFDLAEIKAAKEKQPAAA